MVWILLALACTSSDGETAATESDVESVDTEDTEIEPQWSADDVETALIRLFDKGLPDASEWLEVYVDYLSHGDEDCPGVDYQLVPSNVPIDGCYSEEGWFYQGVSTYTDVETDDGTGFTFTADMTMADPDGNELRGGGSVDYWVSDPGKISLISGTFVGQGQGNWLDGEGLSAAQFLINRLPEGGVVVQGATSLDTVGVLYHEFIHRPNCGFTGAIEVRGELDDRWYDVDFGDDCTYCANVSFKGEELGEACLIDHPTFPDE